MSREQLNELDDMLSSLAKTAKSLEGSQKTSPQDVSTPTAQAFDLYSNIISPPKESAKSNGTSNPAGKVNGKKIPMGEKTFISTANHEFNQAPGPPPPIVSRVASAEQLNLYRTKSHEVLAQPPPKQTLKQSQSSDFMVGAPSDVVQPPLPQSGLNNSANSKQEMDGPEELDFGEDMPDTPDVAAMKVEQRKRQSVMINFADATVDDYQNLDHLLDELDVIVKKNKGADRFQVTLPSNHSTMQDEEDELPRRTDSLEPPPAIKAAPAVAPKPTTQQKLIDAAAKLAIAKVKKVTVRIYIENASTFKTLVVTSLQSAQDIAVDLVKKGKLDDSPEWTLFEIINDWGIARPLRDFEVVTDVMQTWGPESTNSLLLKKYGYRKSLTVEGALDTYACMCGWMYVETKKNKFQKRFCELKSDGIYWAKDAKGTNAALLCNLDTFEVYTLMKLRDKAPTKFCFAMKSQELESIFENSLEYCHFMFVDHLQKLKDWVLSIRSAKITSYLKSQGLMDQTVRENYSWAKQNEMKKALSNDSLRTMTKMASGEKLNNMSKKPSVERLNTMNKMASTEKLNKVLPSNSDPAPALRKSSSKSSKALDDTRPLMPPPERPPKPKAADLEPVKQQFSNLARAKSTKKPSGQAFQQYSSVPQSSAHLIQKLGSTDSSLVGIIGLKQGDPVDNSGQPVNVNAFHKSASQPLVPLSKKELENIPGVKIDRYAATQKEQPKKASKKCATCNCTDFARNPFKETSCANCFHQH